MNWAAASDAKKLVMHWMEKVLLAAPSYTLLVVARISFEVIQTETAIGELDNKIKTWMYNCVP